MARSGISSLENQPYRLPPTTDMGSAKIVSCRIGVVVPCRKMSKSTARVPAWSLNVCRNVYHPDVEITRAGRHEFGGAVGLGQGTNGLATDRVEFVLV